jgi:hypothetical protein
MLPIPIMSTETLASCAEARQTGAAKTIDANKDCFTMHQFIPAPLARPLKVGCHVSPPIGYRYRGMPLPMMPARSAAPSRFGQRVISTASRRIRLQRDRRWRHPFLPLFVRVHPLVGRDASVSSIMRTGGAHRHFRQGRHFNDASRFHSGVSRGRRRRRQPVLHQGRHGDPSL